MSDNTKQIEFIRASEAKQNARYVFVFVLMAFLFVLITILNINSGSIDISVKDIFSIIFFGVYGVGYNAADFIYMQF